MEEQTLTEQALESKPEESTANPLPQPPDSLQVAENMMSGLMHPFSDALLKLGNNELRKLLKLLVQFPFIETKKLHLNKNQKVAFMFGERIIHANMVRRARAELDRTFGEAAKEVAAQQTDSSTTDTENKKEETNGQQA